MGDWIPAAGDVIAERFLLVEEMARGGMGAVWRAKHTGLDIECAVKFIATARIDDELRARFRREARAAAKLKSRFVVNMLDYGVWQDQPYIAMELLDGEPLSDRLEREGSMDVDDTLKMVSGVARALAAAWSLGIVHRDLKPENIFLVHEDGETHPKVVDFGIAKVNEQKLEQNFNTDTGAILGTPWYMSPEQLDGTMKLDVRSDLFALSVITYECLTGELAFDGEAFGNLMSKIMHGERPTPSTVMPSLPAAFDAWWKRAAAIDPEERFATAKEWTDALRMAFDYSRDPTGSWDIAPPPKSSAPSMHDIVDQPTQDATTRKRAIEAETFGGQSRASGKRTRGAGRMTWIAAGLVLGIGAVGLWAATSSPDATPDTAVAAPQPEPETPPAASTPSAKAKPLPVATVVPSATPSVSASVSASAAPVAPRLPFPPPGSQPVTKPKPNPGGLAPDNPGF